MWRLSIQGSDPLLLSTPMLCSSPLLINQVTPRYSFPPGNSNGGWRSHHKPRLIIHALERSVRGNKIPLPKQLFRTLLAQVLPRVVVRKVTMLLLCGFTMHTHNHQQTLITTNHSLQRCCRQSLGRICLPSMVEGQVCGPSCLCGAPHWQHSRLTCLVEKQLQHTMRR